MNYKILSLDGGGCWSVLQVRALEALYGDIGGHELLSKFNLVVSNSGGSLIAACLFNDLSLGQITALIGSIDIRRSIFSMLNPNFKSWIPFISDISPKYRTTKKYQALDSILSSTGRKIGKLPLNQIKSTFDYSSKCPELLVMAFDYDRDRAVFFRSNTTSKTSSLNPIPPPTLTEAIHASSTAPIMYFDEPAVLHSAGYEGKRFWDGAIGGYNNPIMAGITEAVGNGVQASEIYSLSIGTGNTCLPISGKGHASVMKGKISGGFKANLSKMARSILYDPPDAATFIAHTVTGGQMPSQIGQVIINSNIVRLNPLIRPFFNGMEWIPPASLDHKSFEKLVKLELDAVEVTEFNLVLQLGNIWIDFDSPINQPIRMNSDLGCEIGFDKFSNAKARAISLFP